MQVSMNHPYQQMATLGRAKPSSHRIAGALTDGLERFLVSFSVWHDRWRQRQALAALDDHALVDLGLERQQVLAEVEKPFWRS